MKTLLLVSLILSIMVYIGLKFFSAPSPSWGLAFKSRSQTFQTNVIFTYIIKTDWFHKYMVIIIGLKFYLAQSVHLCLIVEVKGFILCVIEVFQCYNIKHITAISRVGGIHAPLGTLSSLKLGHLMSETRSPAKSKENLVDALEVTFLKWSSWILLKMFVSMISNWRIFPCLLTFSSFFHLG